MIKLYIFYYSRCLKLTDLENLNIILLYLTIIAKPTIKFCRKGVKNVFSCSENVIDPEEK